MVINRLTIVVNDYDQVHWHWVPYSDGGRAKDSCSSASCAQQVALKEKKKTQFLDRSSLRPQICSLSSTPQCRNSHSGSLFTDGCSTATLKSVWGWMDGILLLEQLVVLKNVKRTCCTRHLSEGSLSSMGDDLTEGTEAQAILKIIFIFLGIVTIFSVPY